MACDEFFGDVALLLLHAGADVLCGKEVPDRTLDNYRTLPTVQGLIRALKRAYIVGGI